MMTDESAEYQNFLEDVQSMIAERVEVLRARQSAMTPKVFLDSEKVVRDWPELAGRILEDLH